MTHPFPTSTHHQSKNGKASNAPRSARPTEAARQPARERDTLDEARLALAIGDVSTFVSAMALRAPLPPSISYADDHEAIASADSGKEWLERATESQHSGSAAAVGERNSAPSFEKIAQRGDEAMSADDSIFDRDTEPSLDVSALREALRASEKV